MKLYIKSTEEYKMDKSLRTEDELSAIDLMSDNDAYQDDPEVGMFWYDRNKNELFGVHSSLSGNVPWYHSTQWNTDIKTDTHLHKNVWNKEMHRGRDARFKGNHTLVPRGRVFEFKDDGFRVYTGDWINQYPQARSLIIEEFNLPADVKFIAPFIFAKHLIFLTKYYIIGHGWSDEF